MKKVKTYAKLMEQVKDDPEMYEYIKKARNKALFEHVFKQIEDYTLEQLTQPLNYYKKE